MFDAIAGRYDFLNHVLSAGIDRRWRRRAIEALALRGGERVLDLCTGTADLAIAARTAQPAARHVIGVDFAGAMLNVARDKLAGGKLASSVALVRGDATRVPIGDQSVDAVTIAFGIRNVQDVAATAAEIRRVLKVNGRLAILEFALPTAPVVRGVYLWYFKNILPRIGRMVSRHSAAYEYLPASVGAFESPDELVKILRHAGLRDVKASSLTFGIVFLYTGSRLD
jgi:demethylmenaquinone methyltransferase/2-methoxy-6-polyprenyl-1,4-benzoquinol methylase